MQIALDKPKESCFEWKNRLHWWVGINLSFFLSHKNAWINQCHYHNFLIKALSYSAVKYLWRCIHSLFSRTGL